MAIEKKFRDNEEVVAYPEVYFEVKDKLYHKNGIEILEYCCIRGIVLDDIYVE